jgi:hypothetical protein
MVVGGLAGLAAVSVSTVAATTVVRRERTYLPRGHANRIDGTRNPLGSALRYGCAGLTVGVEVDARGRLRVASAPGTAAGPTNDSRTLSRLVLDPLHARVRAKGRVYDTQHQSFTVVLEPADGVLAGHVQDVLDDELTAYTDMLTRCVGGITTHAAVLIVLAGAPRAVLDARRHRLHFGEGTLADVDRRVPTSAVPVVGEHVAWRLSWDGRGEMPGEERHLLRALVRAAHAEGKRVRFFGVPESRRTVRLAFWRELHAAGVDLIGADELGPLRRFLRTQRAHRETA